jgi:uncharacterized protein with HEPN domain
MPRDPRKYLWDALQAAGLAQQFTSGRTFDDYLSDVMVRSAVERQLEIVGEALNQLAKGAPDVAALIPELRRVVAFRNILAHGYTSVDDALVWQLLTEKLPALERAIRAQLPDEA